MAPKTFAHGWAILAAMDRPGDHGGIVFQWSDDWMLGEELQRLLPLGPIPDQLPELRQPVASVGECRFAGFFELRAGVLLGECQEALYNAVAFYASGNDNGLGPGMCLQADRPYLAEQIGDASFESIDLRGVQVPGIGAEAALIVLGMDRNLLHPVVEHPHRASVPPHPDLAAEIFRRHRVVGLGDLDMAVAADLPLGLAEVLKASERERKEGGAFRFFEVRRHLPLGRPMDSGVGGAPLPVLKVLVLFVEGWEYPSLEGVVLNVADAPLDLALVPRCSRLGGECDRALVSAEVRELRIELRIEPVGLDHTGFEVVDDNRARHATEGLEGVLQAPDEVIG